MKTEHIRITYHLTFLSAFHFGTGLRNGLVHRAIARDTEGFLYVPGSTLKGVVRDRCEQLARIFDLRVNSPHVGAKAEASTDQNLVARIFGTRFHPGHVYFDDAQMIPEDRHMFEASTPTLEAQFRARQTERRTQVSLSRLTRTARPGLLYSSEYGIRNIRFEGQIVGLLTGFAMNEGGPATYSLLLLLAGLKSLDRIGGNKSTGAGRVVCSIDSLEVDEQPVDPDQILGRIEEMEYYQIAREEVI